MKLEYGDILFVKGSHSKEPFYDKFVHWGICNVTNSPYYHVCYFVRDNLVFEANGFRNAGYAKLDDYIFDVKRLNFPAEIRTKIMNEIIKTEGARYDWLEILSILIRKKFGIPLFYDDRMKYICSGELMAATMKVLGIEIVPNQSTEDVSPGDVYASPFLIDVK